MAALTPADVDRLKAKLDAGDRAGFYLLYHDLTGSNQALTQAEISSFSGELGQLAMHANAAARAWFAPFLSIRPSADVTAPRLCAIDPLHPATSAPVRVAEPRAPTYCCSPACGVIIADEEDGIAPSS